MTQQKDEKLKISQEEALHRLLSGDSTAVAIPKFNPETSGTENTAAEKKQLKALEDYHNLILNLYKQKYKGEPEKDKNGNDVFRFNSPEELNAFFKDLADQNVPFLSLELDPSGNPTGNYKMSYGDGKLHEGKVDPSQIQTLEQQFFDKIKNPEPKPNPSPSPNTNQDSTSDFRSRLANQKQMQSGTESNESLDSSKKSTLPNPFDTDTPELKRK